MSGSTVEATGRIIYGGSFNPLHIGHLRLAIECMEMLAPLARELDFVPSFCPPHKLEQPILPFELRCALIRQAISSMTGFFCNALEGERKGPSFTYDTMGHYLCTFRPENLYFLLGSEDLPHLPYWHEGRALPKRCNLVVVPRGDCSRQNFAAMTEEIWPGAMEDWQNASLLSEEAGCMTIPDGQRIYYLPVPYLDIRASRIRRLWLRGRNIRCLVAKETLQLLDNNVELVRRSWQENIGSCST